MRRRIQPGSKRREGGKGRALSTRCYSARSRREIQKHQKGGFLIRVLADRGLDWDPLQVVARVCLGPVAVFQGPASLYCSRVEL